MKTRPRPTKRIAALDGLRGIAALMVAINHSYLILAIGSVRDIWNRPLFTVPGFSGVVTQLILFFANGRIAVTLFFLMSGYVLGKSLARTGVSWRSVLLFYTKRFFRLYPVFLVVILGSVLFIFSGYNYQKYAFTSDWYNIWLPTRPTLEDILSNLRTQSISLSQVTWTLRVEMRIVFLFPLLYVLSTLRNRLLQITIAGLLGWIGWHYLQNIEYMRYAYIFYLGLILPSWKHTFRKNFVTSTSFFPFVQLALLFTVLLVHNILPFVRSQYIETFLLWILLGQILYYKAPLLKHILILPSLRYLGEISYPFYLLNFLLLSIISNITLTYFPIKEFLQYNVIIHTLFMITSIGLSVGVSMLIHTYIELPCIAFSSSFSRYLSPKIFSCRSAR